MPTKDPVAVVGNAAEQALTIFITTWNLVNPLVFLKWNWDPYQCLHLHGVQRNLLDVRHILLLIKNAKIKLFSRVTSTYALLYRSVSNAWREIWPCRRELFQNVRILCARS
jgi:hypothetical protein